jgi:hypothetical protein
MILLCDPGATRDQECSGKNDLSVESHLVNLSGNTVLVVLLQ